MRARLGPGILCLLAFSAAAVAFVIGPSSIEQAGAADLVAIARPVKTQRMQVSASVEYELATFAVERAIRGTPAAIGTARGLPRICVLHQTAGEDLDLRDHPLLPDQSYLLILKKLPPAGSYGLLSEYEAIPEATDENLRAVRKRLFGAEEEPLATLPLPLDAAEALAVRILGDIVTTTAQRLADAPDAPTRSPTPYNDATAIGSPLFELRHDRRMLGCAAKIDGLFEFDERPFEPPSPSAGGGFMGNGEPQDETPCAIVHGCRFYVRDILYSDNTSFPGALYAWRDAPTPRGTVTAMVALRMEGGLYGDFIAAAEACRVSLGGLSFLPPDDWQVEKSDEEPTVDMTAHGGDGHIRVRVPREDAWNGEKTAPRPVPWDGVRAMMRFQAPRQALVATEAESVSLTAAPRATEVGGCAAIFIEGIDSGSDDPAAGRFELFAIEGKTPVIVVLKASPSAWPARAAELEEMLAGMRQEP